MIAFVYALFWSLVVASDDKPNNMHRLGRQRPSEGHVDVLRTIPSVEDFFQNHIAPGRPVLLKGAAKNIPAFNLWTDDYLRTKFGSVNAIIEEGKKENKSKATIHLSFEEFLSKYKTEDIYMIHSLPQNMTDEISLLPCFSCGGFMNFLQDVVLWFSSGGTKSVLHADSVDNMNCLLSGKKELYMVDKKYEDLAHLDVKQHGFSSVDVDAVDLTKYPNFANIPWHEAHMAEGDCLFIPFKWLHQVRSYDRNIAVTVLFSHVKRIDFKDCETNRNKGKYVPLTGISRKPLEMFRNILFQEMHINGENKITKRGLIDIMKESGEDPNSALINGLWKLADTNSNGAISEDELKSIKEEDFNLLRQEIAMFDTQKNSENNGKDEKRYWKKDASDDDKEEEEDKDEDQDEDQDGEAVDDTKPVDWIKKSYKREPNRRDENTKNEL